MWLFDKILAMWSFDKIEGASDFEDEIELSRQLPMFRKMDIAKLIIEKITNIDSLNEQFEPEVRCQIEGETINIEDEWREARELISPGDLAMMYLFKLSEVARAAGDVAILVQITGAMSKLLGVAPKGSLHAKTLELPLRAFSND